MPDPRDSDDAVGARLREVAPVARDVQAEQWHGSVAARLFGGPTRSPRIGRYHVMERLGGGASGEVWAAIDPELDRRVAIKVLHDAFGEQLARAAMVREAKSLAKLSHPNVVPVFDAGMHEGRVFVTLELVEGSTMRAWLATTPGWREVVEVFAQAARGLQAAHAAGIVHRDFKPENVLIGADGRVRVSDFGIARAAGPAEPAAIGDTITSTAGIGTPAYMAPEQFLGDAIDARADQFGFSVALHEALYGERPFSGRDRAALAANVAAGRRRMPAVGTEVPRWLERVVARGLAVDPSRRFADMTAVLRELERPRRRRAPLWIAGALAVAAIGVAQIDDGAAVPRCGDGAARLFAVWSPAGAARIRDAFVATGSPRAAERAEGLIAEFDRFASAWQQAHQSACAAELDEGTRIAQQYCLHTRLLELESMAIALARADGAVVEHAAIVATTLRAPSECLYVAASVEVPMGDPEQDLELRAAIASARALGDVGKFADGLAAADEATTRAVELGNRSLEAEALLVTAELENPLLGNVADVDPIPTLHAAVLAAEAAHRPDLVAAARVASIESELARGDFARVRALEPGARASAATLGDPPELVGRIDLYAAEAMMLEGRGDDPAVLLGSAREHFEQAGPSSRRWLAQVLNMMGESAFDRGEYEAARQQYARALAIVREDLRAHHLIVANASGNLAETYFVVGEFDIAWSHFDDALAIRRDVFGEGSVWVNHTLGHLGDIAWERGDADGALAMYEAALARPTGGADPAAPTVAAVLHDLQSRLQRAWMLNGAALALVDLGRYDEALAYAEQTAGAPLPDDRHHPDLTSRIDVRGVVLLAMGRHDEAVVAFADALARLERGYPAGTRAIAFASFGLGRAHVEAGSAAAAIDPLERGLAILSSTPHAYPRAQAAARFALGRALFVDGARTDAGREQVRRAIALLADAEGFAERERAGYVAWLESHP